MSESRIALAVGNDTVRNNSFYFESVEKVDRFRVTGLQMAEECGHYWRQSFLREFRDPEQDNGNKYSRAGTIYHLLIENHIRQLHLREDFLSPEEMVEAINILAELGFINEYAKLQAYCTRLSRILKDAEILEVEKDLQIWEDPNIAGQVDLLYRKDGVIWVHDHKSNRKPDRVSKWQGKFQMNAYSYAVMKLYDVPKVHWCIGQTNHDNDIYFVHERDDTAFEERLMRSLSAIREDTRSAGAHCRYCNASETCEEKMEADKWIMEL